MQFDDIVQEITLYIYTSCGDLLYNFKNSPIFINKTISRAAKVLLSCNKNKHFRSVKEVFNIGEYDYLDYLPFYDETSEVEEITIGNLNYKIKDIVINYISMGYSPSEGIKLVSKKLKISEDDVRNIIKNQLCEEPHNYKLQYIN